MSQEPNNVRAVRQEGHRFAVLGSQPKEHTLIIQNRDGSLTKEPRKPRHPQPGTPSYHVEFPAALLDEQNSLIERIISFAFDTLDARRLQVRVREAE